MAVAIFPIIKAVAPYLAQIATAAIPAFTSKPADAAKSAPVMAQQIEELQAAATQNAESIHVLAEKLQQAIQGIEMAAEEARKQVATLYYRLTSVKSLFSEVSRRTPIAPLVGKPVV